MVFNNDNWQIKSPKFIKQITDTKFGKSDYSGGVPTQEKFIAILRPIAFEMQGSMPPTAHDGLRQIKLPRDQINFGTVYFWIIYYL